MLKWKISAFLGLIVGIAGVAWGFAEQQKAPGYYELRVYTAQPGKRDALAQRFAERTAALYAKHGITNVGYWIPEQSDSELGISAENTFIYIRGYPSKEERDMLTSYKSGVNSYIQKPVDFDRFRETIHTLALYWLSVNQWPPCYVLPARNEKSA